MSKARIYGMTSTRDTRTQNPFKKGKPNNSRCPKCHAKLKRSCRSIQCNRCGYYKLEEEDNLTKAFIKSDYETIF